MKRTKTTTSTRPKGMTVHQLVRAANRWRDGYNPLRGLGIARVVSLLEAGERGDYADLQWTYRLVEKRFAVLRALKARRTAALLKLDWDIRVSSEVPKGMETLAGEQQAALREAYDGIANLRDALRALALAEFRGFAHLQKHRGADGEVEELHWLGQWNWVRNGQFGDWAWNPEAKSVSFDAFPADQRIGEGGLPREDFVIRECDSPIDEIAIIAFMNSSLAKKDWAAFVEIFGIPGSVVILPPDVPAGREAEYEESATAVAEGASGALPHGADVKFPSAGIRGVAPFKEFLEYEEKEVVLAGTGGKLTMLTESGSGTLAGGAHQDSFDDLAAGEADEISEVFQRDFDAQILEARFPGAPVLAYFELSAGTDHDADQVVERVAKLHAAGFQADPEEISEKTGLKIGLAETPESPVGASGNRPPVEGAKSGQRPRRSAAEGQSDPEEADDDEIRNRNSPSGGGTAAETAFQEAAYRQLETAVQADLAPVIRRLAAIDKIADPEIRKSRLEAFLAEYEQLIKDITADPEAASALARIQGTAVAEGMNREPIRVPAREGRR